MPPLKVYNFPCFAARVLEVLGDRWTLLLIREAAFGTRRFDGFAAHAKLYWFNRPLQGISLALLAYVAGFIVANVRVSA